MSGMPRFPDRAAPATRPPGAWPFWLAFALMLLPGILVLGALGLTKDTAAGALELQRDALGRSEVLTGELVDVDTTSGMPKTSSVYEVEIPDAAAKGLDATLTFGGGEHWGFPPSKEYPAELSFLVVYDDPPYSPVHGPVGRVEPVTEQSAASAESGFVTAQIGWVAGIVVFWVLAVGLPALAIRRSVRRRRAKRVVTTAPLI
ncbi:hypothetical protein [Herbiconiux liangxiaofengii]|uniref:hypothetical protein n=1 Tax=Herbiconiux liangxiaofengii TaxID=3342795 RepID=UPI0035BB0E1A